MKKVFLALAAVAAVFASCNNAPKANDQKSATAPSELKIAYVDYDTIMSQYTFAKESNEALQKKSNNAQSTLAAKQQALQAAAAKLQQDYQANQLTQEQAQQRQAAIQQQGQDLDALNQRLTNEMQTEAMNAQKAVYDSIQNYLKVYNKDKKYTLILTKSTILYADGSNDITAEIVAGLNKAYKPVAKKAETKAEAKK